jgi:hypothetical protein
LVRHPTDGFRGAEARTEARRRSKCGREIQKRERSATSCCGTVQPTDATGLDLLGAGQQLGGCEVESYDETTQAAVARISLASLDVGDPALMQAGVIGDGLLGAPEFFAPGLDGEAKGELKGWGGGHEGQPPE